MNQMTLLQRLRPKATEDASEGAWLGSYLLDAASEIERLQRDCGEAYQVVGAALLGEPRPYTQADVARVLDNLGAAASGRPRPHDDLLPWPQAGQD